MTPTSPKGGRGPQPFSRPAPIDFRNRPLKRGCRPAFSPAAEAKAARSYHAHVEHGYGSDPIPGAILLGIQKGLGCRDDPAAEALAFHLEYCEDCKRWKRKRCPTAILMRQRVGG